MLAGASSPSTVGGAVPTSEPPSPEANIRELVVAGRLEDAWRQLVPGLLSADSRAADWSVARSVLRAGAKAGWAPPTARAVRLAVLCTYEAAELREQLRIACLAMRIDAELYAAPYGQVEQELLGGAGALARFDPTHVLLAPSTEDLAFPQVADDAGALIEAAEVRWRSLWRLVQRDLGARVLQHGCVVPDESPLGHLAARVPGSRVAAVRELNRRLAAAAGTEVLLVDTERLAARIGKHRWLDPRLWYSTRQPYGSDAMIVLARETAAVLEGDVGLTPRCLVVDLDNTLWGGIVGEEGPAGIAVGEGRDGEAYAAFQEYLRALARRGVILAVASKNDAEGAREPFATNPAMRLRLDDFAAFVADWRPKSEQLTEIAATLGLGLDALAFVDDNPAECAQVEAALPAVRTLCLDVPPTERVRLLAGGLRFELSSLTGDELGRSRSYAARAQAAELQAGAASLEDFWRSLDMRASVRALDDASLDRAAQLTQKTNQFNLTLRRRTREDVQRLDAAPGTICLTLELTDRFASHGLIALAFAVPAPEDPRTAEIDTLLMSCRAIGRTAEVHLLSHLSRQARAHGFAKLRGVYVPGPRNSLVADLYPRLGFVPAAPDGNRWEYDLAGLGPIESLYIADLT